MNSELISRNLLPLRPLTSMKNISSNEKIPSLPILIQLCLYPDENESLNVIKSLFSSNYSYSPNVSDQFHCNALMYTLRYQRYRLFHFLIEETSIHLNLRATDKQGNTILHYAVVYDGFHFEILEKLIEKCNQYKIDIDQRNQFGFTPLLLGMILNH